ncbi:hypothetical protein BSA16_33840 [Micromonospora sp. Rc5]|nr:hypothetical protein BSA16_33840 [Micromonospora sp. Rc5]
MPTYLKNLPIADRDRELQTFIQMQEIASLGWPEDVVRQWLYDHGGHPDFLVDYKALDLSRIQWTLEDVAVAELETIPTGSSE